MSCKPKFHQVLRAIGGNTLGEILKDRILYNILLCALIIFSLGIFASRLVVVRPDRVVLDFGYSSVNISCAVIAIFTGSGLLSREIRHRTIFTALTRPISRTQFITGKMVGLVGVLGLNWILLSLTYLAILHFSSEHAVEMISGTLFCGLFLGYLQAIVLSSLAILFSTFSTASLSVILSIGFYLIGTNISHLRWVAHQTQTEWIKSVLVFLSLILPNFEHFQLGTLVTYSLPLDPRIFVESCVYGALLSGLFLLVAGGIIQKRAI